MLLWCSGVAQTRCTFNILLHFSLPVGLQGGRVGNLIDGRKDFLILPQHMHFFMSFVLSLEVLPFSNKLRGESQQRSLSI